MVAWGDDVNASYGTKQSRSRNPRSRASRIRLQARPSGWSPDALNGAAALDALELDVELGFLGNLSREPTRYARAVRELDRISTDVAHRDENPGLPPRRASASSSDAPNQLRDLSKTTGRGSSA